MEETGSKAHLVPLPLSTQLEQPPDRSRVHLPRIDALQREGPGEPTWPDLQTGTQEPPYAVHHYLHIGAYQNEGGLAKAPLTSILHGYWMYRRGRGIKYNAA